MVEAHGAASLDALDGLDAVADGVAEIEGLAHPMLRLVLLDDALFETEAAVNNFADLLVDVALLEDGEQFRVGQQTGLHRLGQTVDVLAAGQGGEGAGVYDDQLGLPEGADDVLRLPQIHSGLAADGGIDHREGGGGAVDEVDAAHIDGSGKTRQVAHDAAAHGDDEVAAAHVELQHLAQDAFEDLHALAGLALRDRNNFCVAALVGHTLCVLGGNACVRHHRHPAVEAGKLVQIFQCAVFQDDVIAALTQIHGELGADKSTHFVYTPNSRTVRQVWSSSRSSAAVSSAEGSPTSST